MSTVSSSRPFGNSPAIGNRVRVTLVGYPGLQTTIVSVRTPADVTGLRFGCHDDRPLYIMANSQWLDANEFKVIA